MYYFEESEIPFHSKNPVIVAGPAMALAVPTTASGDQQAQSAFTPSLWQRDAKSFVENPQHILRVALYRVPSGLEDVSSSPCPPTRIANIDLLDVEQNDCPRSSAVSCPAVVPPFSSQGVPSASAWEKHRAKILHLYLEEDRTLSEIMQIMYREHIFKATVKMFKSRLKRWNARKYMTKSERDRVSQTLRDRKCRGEPYGRVIVRGKHKNLDLFLRHMGHSRARGVPLDDNDQAQEDVIIESLASPMLPKYPTGLEMNLAILCREMPHLVLQMPEHGVSYEFFYAVKQACNHFQGRDPGKVRASLNLAAEWFRTNLNDRPALVFMSLLRSQTITGYDDFYRAEWFRYIYEHLFNLTKVTYGSEHALTKLISRILKLASEPRVMQSAFENVVPHIIALLQKNKSAETYKWQELLATKLSKAGDRAKAGQLLVDAVSSFEKDDVFRDKDKWKCMLTLARHYILHESNRDEEAEYMLRVLLEAGTNPTTREVDPWHANFVFNALGQLAEKRGDLDAAIHFYQLRSQGAAKEWGKNAALTLHTLERPAKLLRLLGRGEAAAVLEKRIQAVEELE